MHKVIISKTSIHINEWRTIVRNYSMICRRANSVYILWFTCICMCLSAYQAPRPLPCMVSWPLPTSLRKCSFSVLRLMSVRTTISFTVTRLLTGIVQNFQRKFRQGSHDDMLVFHLPFKALHLLVQGPEEEKQPRLPVWRIRSEARLCLSQGEIIALFAVFDNAFSEL